MKLRPRNRIIKGFGLGVVILGAVTMFLPFFWMLSTSLKSLEEVFRFPPALFPSELRWENYFRTWQQISFGLLFLNSIKVTGLTVVGALFSSTLIAYGFARFRFPGRDLLFGILLATMMLPYAVTMVPVFILFRHLGWVGTHLPLFVPFFFGHTFGIFLLRQFFLTIPSELEEAAKIDGANPWSILWRIEIHFVKPALATVAVIIFMWSWNDLLNPIIYLNTLEMQTVTGGLSFFTGGAYITRYNEQMAGAMLGIIPMVAIYLAAQKYFTAGITLTGLKG